jgi:hypothetical protein
VCLGRRARLPQQHRQHNDQQDMPPVLRPPVASASRVQPMPQAGAVNWCRGAGGAGPGSAGEGAGGSEQDHSAVGR